MALLYHLLCGECWFRVYGHTLIVLWAELMFLEVIFLK